MVRDVISVETTFRWAPIPRIGIVAERRGSIKDWTAHSEMNDTSGPWSMNTQNEWCCPWRERTFTVAVAKRTWARHMIRDCARWLEIWLYDCCLTWCTEVGVWLYWASACKVVAEVDVGVVDEVVVENVKASELKEGECKVVWYCLWQVRQRLVFQHTFSLWGPRQLKQRFFEVRSSRRCSYDFLRYFGHEER